MSHESTQRMIDSPRLDGTEFSRERMRGSRLVVVGLGALGNEVVRQLGLLGAGHVLCVDPDVVDASNLTRSIFYGPLDVGKRKADALLTRVQSRFPQTHWETMDCEIADVGWNQLSEYDLLFGCLDRDSARLEMARIATRIHKPVCDGGLGGPVSRGRVSYFAASPDAACFGCRLSYSVRRQMLQQWSSSIHSCASVFSETFRSSTPIMAAVTAALQVELGLSYLAKDQKESVTTEVDLANLRFEQIAMGKSDACPFHEEPPALVEVPETFASEIPANGALGWEWPVCVHARCRDCGTEWAPMQRTTRISGCPACPSAAITVMEALNRIDPQSPWAARNPQEIGLPSRHLYTVWEGEK